MHHQTGWSRKFGWFEIIVQCAVSGYSDIRYRKAMGLGIDPTVCIALPVALSTSSMLRGPHLELVLLFDGLPALDPNSQNDPPRRLQVGGRWQ